MFEGLSEVRARDGKVWFTAESEQAVAVLSRSLIEGGALIRALEPQTARLEDLFFSLTEGERDGGAEGESAEASGSEATS